MSRERNQPLNNTILEDRPCAVCGYNLRGLSALGLCPECGEPASESAGKPDRRRDPRVIDNSELGQASLGFLLMLVLGLLSCALAGPALLVTLWNLTQGGTDPAWVRASAIAGVVWYLGVLILMHDRPRPMVGEGIQNTGASWQIKLILALTQPAWAASATFLHLDSTGTEGAAEAALGSFTIACIGLPCFPMLVSSLSEWTLHDALTSRLRSAAWALGAGVVVNGGFWLGSLTKFPGLGLFVWVKHLASLLWLIGFIASSLFCLELVVIVRWAVVNSRERAHMRRRIAERRREWESSVRPAPPIIADQPAPSDPAARDTPRVQLAGEHLIERAPDVQPYGLEDTAPDKPA